MLKDPEVNSFGSFFFGLVYHMVSLSILFYVSGFDLPSGFDLLASPIADTCILVRQWSCWYAR